jgi:hypothetical protein
MTERRRFIVKASGAMAAVAATIIDAPDVIAQPKVQWRMSTAFTAVFDIHQGAAQRLAKIVEETSGGRFRIEVFPAGQIMQPFDCFDAASQGKIEAFMGPGQYWTAKEAVGRGRQGGIREKPHGPEGARVVHEVPGAGGPLGPRRRRRLPSARRGVRRIA